MYTCVCFSYYNAESHSFDTERYSSTEPAYVDQVKMLFDDCGEKKYRLSDVTARSDRLLRVFLMLRVKVGRRLSLPGHFSRWTWVGRYQMFPFWILLEQ